MGLEMVMARHVRAEALARESEYQHAFDVVICRAFSSLDNFVGMALPFLAPGGAVIALKGKTAEMLPPEINGRRIEVSTTTYSLPFDKGERCIYSVQVQDTQ